MTKDIKDNNKSSYNDIQFDKRAEEIQSGVCVMYVWMRGSDMIGEIQVQVLVIANKLCVSKPCFILIL